MASPKVLVTGATGFVASHVLTQLVLKGYRVRGTVRSVASKKKYRYIDDVLARHPEFQGNVEFVEADLLNASSWDAAVEGCSYIMHIASPFFFEEPKDPNELIKPAVEGTLNVLQAASRVGGVKRVVLTSSVVSIMTADRSETTYSEAEWAPTEGPTVTAYPKSKTLAERAAWDFVEHDRSFELVTINPGLIIGPAITESGFTTANIIGKIMTKGDPGAPKLMMYAVDVRDVANAHILGMEVPEAAGQRFIAVERSCWMKEYATILKNEFSPYGYSIKDRELCNCMIKFASLFDKSLKPFVPVLGVRKYFDSSRAERVLGLTFRPLEETLVDMGYSLAKHGFIKDRTNGEAAKRIIYP